MKTLRHLDPSTSFRAGKAQCKQAQGRPLRQAQGKLLRHICLLVFVFLVVNASASDEKLAFRSEQRKGANGDGGKNPEVWFRSAGELGLQFVRLSPVTWQSAGRDFLLGNADDFTGIEPADLNKLEQVLDIAQRHNVKIVLTMFSLPGARYRQLNDYKFDYRLWTDERFQQQALAFWRELAQQLKDHPAIVAYNPLNEPHPARKDGFESGNTEGFEEWLWKNRDTPADLNRFNHRVVEAIRQVDSQTPILLDCWFHAAPEGFGYLMLVKDDRILYSFHFYTPWNYTTYRVNKERFSYPNAMPVGWSEETKQWTSAGLRRCIRPVIEWAKRYNIPSEAIVVGEFGCDRRVGGAKKYLNDLVAIFNEHRWHWAFYSYRSPDWDGMDYELGVEKLGWKYWQAREQGKEHEELIRRRDNPLWDVFKREFAKK